MRPIFVSDTGNYLIGWEIYRIKWMSLCNSTLTLAEAFCWKESIICIHQISRSPSNEFQFGFPSNSTLIMFKKSLLFFRSEWFSFVGKWSILTFQLKLPITITLHFCLSIFSLFPSIHINQRQIISLLLIKIRMKRKPS